jgi:hypothetical protein
LEATLGLGTTNQGVRDRYRPTASMHGVPVAKEMGINTWALWRTDDAVVDGDFAMQENGSTRPARHAEGWHQHRRYPPAHEPRAAALPFLHYWGKGNAVDLAQSLKRVLDVQAAVKS